MRARFSALQARPTYVSEADIGACTLAGGASIVGIIGFGAPRPGAYAQDGPFTSVPMRRLDDAVPYEVWTSPHPVRWLSEDGATCGVAGDTLFATLHAPDPDERGTQAAAFDLYSRTFALVERTGHPHLIRASNFIPHITANENGVERYRRFNAGRQQAFMARNRAVEAAPAACALGTESGSVILCVIASTTPGRPIENPRQVSAYRYPPIHGPSSPIFSRAMLTSLAGASHLHISGTASIVGHQSLHPGDVGAQAAEVIRNIEALLNECGHDRLAGSLLLRVYVRDLRDVPVVRDALATLNCVEHIMFLQAEICRKELLVEMEAFAQLA